MSQQRGNTAGEAASFPFFDGQFSANPFPLLAQMRAMGAVVSVPLPFDGSQRLWMVTRMQEAVQVLKEKRFTVDPSTLQSAAGTPRQQERTRAETPGLFGESMISVDDPDHKRLRGLVSKAFTPRYIEGLRPHIQQIADDLLDRVQDQGHMDIVRDYAYPLPINVISDILGVPRKNREQIRVWAEALAGGERVQDEERTTRVRSFSEYIVQLVAEKRQHPQEDLLSQLIQMEEEGDHLSEAELLSMASLLIFAGHETTSNLISIGSLMLLDHVEQLEKLKADLSLVPSAVEEMLRFNGPVLSPVPRFATEDLELGGQSIHKGDMVITMLASANRDESQFTDPDELDIARRLNRHIAFGQGIHMCLGAPLARLEGDIAFTTLLKRMPKLRLTVARETITWRGNFTLRGLTSLPVAF
jgi:cytochrome P450